jgi:hypothetical protein
LSQVAAAVAFAYLNVSETDNNLNTSCMDALTFLAANPGRSNPTRPHPTHQHPHASPPTAVFAREPRRRFVVQGATDTVVISLSGTAIGTSAVLNLRFGWQAFISIYMVIQGLLLLLACWLAFTARRAARAAAAAARPGA